MEEHESVRPRILRRLIKHIGMIDMLCLSGRIKRMRSVIRPLRLQRLSAAEKLPCAVNMIGFSSSIRNHPFPVIFLYYTPERRKLT